MIHGPEGRHDDLSGLKGVLNALVLTYGPQALPSDPVRFPRRYPRREDSELAALLAALFAYGNVTAMGSFLERLLGKIGSRPSRFLRGDVPAGGWPKYRFQTGTDVAGLLAGIGRVLEKHDTLEACFISTPGSAEERLQSFAESLREAAEASTRGLLHLLPLPAGGSACKRWWMFLRWVVRPDDGVDLGLWTCADPSQLRLPIDTHMARMARCLGLSQRRTADRRLAVEATETLRRICPEDPVRYDFALTRLGILGLCKGVHEAAKCDPCPLREFCVAPG